MKAKLYISFSLIFLGICTAVSVAAVKDSRDTTSLNASLNGEIHQLAEQVDSQDCLSEDVHHQINMIEEKICFYIERYHDHTAQLLSMIGVLMTIVIASVGIVVPWMLTKRRENNVDEKLKELEDKLTETQKLENTINDIKKSIEEEKNRISELYDEIKEDKDQISKLQVKIEKDKEASETAAKQAKDSERLSESYSFFSSGNAKYHLGDKKGAIEDYDKAIELNPNFADAYNNRGVSKSDLGDEEGAIEDYDKVIELGPNYADAYYNRGNAKSDLGDKEGAIVDYDKAIELNTNSFKAYHNKAWCLCCMKEYDTALINVNKSLDIEKTDVSLDTRGVINTNLLRFEEALNDFNEAIGMNSKDAEYYEDRAALYRKMAEQEEDTVKKDDLIKKSEADEAKAEGLKK